MSCAIFTADDVKGLREERDAFQTEPRAYVMSESRSTRPSIPPSNKDSDLLISPWEFGSVGVTLPTCPHTYLPCAWSRGRCVRQSSTQEVSLVEETQCPQYQAERSAPKGH